MRKRHFKKNEEAEIEELAGIDKHALTEDEIKELDIKNKELLEKLEEGSTSAMAELIVANAKFIGKIVNDYAKQLISKTVVDEDDIWSEAIAAMTEFLKNDSIEPNKEAFSQDLSVVLNSALSSYVVEANNNFCDEHLDDCVAPGKPKLKDTLTNGKSTLDDILLEQDIERFYEEESNITIK